MEKDALIEAMARRLHGYAQGLGAIGNPWESLGDGRRDYYLRGAGVMLPVVVEFVAAWITGVADHGYLEPSEIAQRWREEMS
jgi:hypothetical protein